MKILRLSLSFIFYQFRQDIYQRSMFFFNHFIDRCMINRNQFDSYSVSIQQLFYYCFIFEIFVYHCQLETLKATYNVFSQKFRNSFRLQIKQSTNFYSINQIIFIITNTFINFDWNKWTQSMLIFWNRLEIQMKWSLLFFRLRARSWHDSQLTTNFSQSR